MKQLLLFSIFAFTLLLSYSNVNAQPQPRRLMTDLIEYTDRVYINGILTSLPLERYRQAAEPCQVATISSSCPTFSWEVDSDHLQQVKQTAWSIILSDSIEAIRQGRGNVWSSGVIKSNRSTSVSYRGTPLYPRTIYYWRVKHFDNHGRESKWSEIKSFLTADSLSEYSIPTLPLVKSHQQPLVVEQRNGYTLLDFGKAAFAQLQLTLTTDRLDDTIVVHFGERLLGNRIHRKPGGTIRYSRYVLPLLRGTHTYRVHLNTEPRHLSPQAVRMPQYIGEVTPFRYVEVEGYEGKWEPNSAMRSFVHYPFDDYAAVFASSDTLLNKVWELCHYSMKATSFTGLFVDGDRERIPYEADALINQLSYYSADREYTIARNTLHYLLQHPTWPTEWILQAPLIAWYDYLYTGDVRTLKQQYELLKLRTLMQLEQPNGLISTVLQKQDQSLWQPLHYKLQEPIKDIVDWPHPGSFGMPVGKGGETDQFVFTSYNTVVNSYYYEALREMGIIAACLGKTDDQLLFNSKAVRVRNLVNKLFFDPTKGIYRDGIETTHSSLHANMFPLAFEMVDEKYRRPVTEFVRSRGMACSVYGSQFLMDAVYNGYDAEYGLELLTKSDERSWYNMIRIGSTITLEAWDDKFKPNQDWNHAWGAVPANTIARKVIGIEPLSAGFERIRLRPQVASLEFVEGRFPTIKGDVGVKIEQTASLYCIDVDLPANTETELWLPCFSKADKLKRSGESLRAKRHGSGQFWILPAVGSGHWSFTIEH